MTGLPEFDAPPVSEVVLSVQFAPLTAFRSAHVGLLWSEFRDEYPIPSEQPPLDPVFETFGGVPQTAPQFRIETFLTPPMARSWFEAPDGQHLLQIQQDRIIHNWRKRQQDQTYPRYGEVRQHLQTEIGLLDAFVRREGLGSLAPNQCEVTYINLIDIPGVPDPHKHLARITPLVSPVEDGPETGDVENVALSARFLLRGDEGPIGRTYATFQPNFLLPDLRPVVRLEVSARGRPAGETVAEALEFLDKGHDAVVRAFAAVTTPEMHKVWRRTDA